MVLLALVLATGAACTGAQQRTYGDQEVIQGERGYVRMPGQLFGGEIEADAVGPQLVQCYETEAQSSPWEDTAVMLELVWDGEHVRPRLTQAHTDLSDRVTACVGRVTYTWDLIPEQVDVGTLHPVELGPLHE